MLSYPFTEHFRVNRPRYIEIFSRSLSRTNFIDATSNHSLSLTLSLFRTISTCFSRSWVAMIQSISCATVCAAIVRGCRGDSGGNSSPRHCRDSGPRSSTWPSSKPLRLAFVERFSNVAFNSGTNDGIVVRCPTMSRRCSEMYYSKVSVIVYA